MITISFQLKALFDRLDAFAQPRGGVTKIMHNQRHMWEELTTLPKDETAPRILIMYSGETARGGFEEAHLLNRVDRLFDMVVIRGRGFKNAAMDDPLSGGVVEPFSDSIETVRDLVRSMLNLSAENPIWYVSTKPLSSVLPSREASAFLDGMVLQFSAATDIPAIRIPRRTN